MPAIEQEVIEGREEGIDIMTLTDPRRIIGENGRVKAVECLKMSLGEPDASGRRRPVPIEGSEFILEVDSWFPLSARNSTGAVLPKIHCRLTDLGTMKVDPITLQTQETDFLPGRCGDRPSTVVSAMASGSAAFPSIVF